MSTSPPAANYDVIIIGGGPAGSVAACLLGQAGYRVLVLERDIHPREHVGESLSPSTNFIFQRIGFLQKMEEAGFVHKPGTLWTAPQVPVGRFVAIRVSECPPPGAFQGYTYHVERDDFDARLLRHAHELGAKVLQGVRVQQVLFEGDRAVGVRAKVVDGWERDLSARFILDASGRRCTIATQLGLKKKDPLFNQLGIYSWYKGVEPNPPGYEGMLVLHFFGMERAWAWQIPLRHGLWSIGIVTDRNDFKQSGMSDQAFAEAMFQRNLTLQHNMRNATLLRPWHSEGDYSYKIDQLTGPGWLLIGDALRFVDPIFSSGVDVATYSALYAFEAIDATLKGETEAAALRAYEQRVSDGVEVWYDLITLFYKLQSLFTFYAYRTEYRKKVIRILQGNLYQPETIQSARELIALMKESYQRVMANPANLLHPQAFALRAKEDQP